MFSSIISAVDFSEHSRRAFRYATGLAARIGGRLAVIHVTDPLLTEAANITYGREFLAGETDNEVRALIADLRLETAAWAPEIRVSEILQPRSSPRPPKLARI